ncbi:hypothetical protein BKA61DRAFT_663727 [Leptodontidium sp. MPI-SDFR-AT-0119]|nr:hypothetical protein BKA61DRAFT_663727 [Leptodontidium sp. MPI-SDFR-AT-0119]
MALSTVLVGSTLTLSSPVPLTTTFIPDAPCLSDVYQYLAVSGNPFEYYLQLGPPETTTCLSSGWGATSQYFSPSVCPTGYSQACWVTSSAGTEIETLATRCPSGYTCASLPPVSYANWLPPLYSSLVCVGTGGRGSSLGTFAVTGVTDGTTVVLNTVLAGGVNAYGVSIRFKAETVAVTGGKNGSATGSSSATTTSSSGSASSTSTVTPDPESGLSTGAKAGIGVALSGFLAWCIFRRRKHTAVTQQYHNEVPIFGKPPTYGGVANSEL